MQIKLRLGFQFKFRVLLAILVLVLTLAPVTGVSYTFVIFFIFLACFAIFHETHSVSDITFSLAHTHTHPVTDTHRMCIHFMRIIYDSNMRNDNIENYSKFNFM